MKKAQLSLLEIAPVRPVTIITEAELQLERHFAQSIERSLQDFSETQNASFFQVSIINYLDTSETTINFNCLKKGLPYRRIYHKENPANFSYYMFTKLETDFHGLSFPKINAAIRRWLKSLSPAYLSSKTESPYVEFGVNHSQLWYKPLRAFSFKESNL